MAWSWTLLCVLLPTWTLAQLPCGGGTCDNTTQVCSNNATCLDAGCNDACANVCDLGLCYCSYAYGGLNCTDPVTSGAAWQVR